MRLFDYLGQRPISTAMGLVELLQITNLNRQKFIKNNIKHKQMRLVGKKRVIPGFAIFLREVNDFC